MIKINKIWRQLATVFCFSTFAFGSFFLSFLVFPLQRLLVSKNKRKRTAQLTVHYSFRMFIKLMISLGILKVDTLGVKNFDDIKGKVIIANHPSLIDVVVLIASIKNADCIVKNELFKSRLLKGVFDATGYISNSDPELLIAACKSSLDSGNNIIIFPEGTRSEKGKDITFKRGAANIAIRCRAHFLPLEISVSPSTLSKEDKWFSTPERKFDFVLKTNEEIDLSSYFDEPNLPLAIRQVTADVESYFKRKLQYNE